jgi:hypothetical protein
VIVPAPGTLTRVRIDAPGVFTNPTRKVFEGALLAFDGALFDLKAAVTLVAPSTVTVQVVVDPEQAPLQPVKVDPLAGVAVRVTEVESVNVALQVAPQVMPAGAEETVPAPVPAVVTVRG